MKLNLDNDRLRELVPNIIYEVDGETPLYYKILPWIELARQWLETELIGNFQPEGELYSLAEKAIVYKSLADAVPSLDLTLTPAGFAVINTDDRIPASKERIERLIASLYSFADDNIEQLCRSLHRQPEWRQSIVGMRFRSSFISDLGFVRRFRRDKDLLSTYKIVREIVMPFEQELAEKYFGFGFLKSLYSAYPDFTTPGSREIFAILLADGLKYVGRHIDDTAISCPDGHEVWHIARPVIARLEHWPRLKEQWAQEMGDKFIVEPFKNTVQGGYFF